MKTASSLKFLALVTTLSVACLASTAQAGSAVKFVPLYEWGSGGVCTTPYRIDDVAEQKISDIGEQEIVYDQVKLENFDDCLSDGSKNEHWDTTELDNVKTTLSETAGTAVASSTNRLSNAATPSIGIDLGTTYSDVGVFQHGKVEIIASDQENPDANAKADASGAAADITDTVTMNVTDTSIKGCLYLPVAIYPTPTTVPVQCSIPGTAGNASTTFDFTGTASTCLLRPVTDNAGKVTGSEIDGLYVTGVLTDEAGRTFDLERVYGAVFLEQTPDKVALACSYTQKH